MKPMITMITIFRDKDKRKELKNEIKVYQLLQAAGVTCLPKFVFGGVVYVFLAVITEFINGKSFKFDQMNNLPKINCVKSLRILHDNDVLHCDLRSSNFIFNENECCIIDFGFSQISEKIDQKALDEFENENEMNDLKKLLLQ
jgi:tRNA A-37 threonylcarbamoyl transferase component Bud32